MTAFPQQLRSFHVMTKPIGPLCNLDCRYCFYLEKEKYYPETRQWKMSDELLESYIRQYIQAQQTPEVSFAWQGGEPTLLGVEYFRRVVELQRQYSDGKKIVNALQTNGTLLDAQWCEFLRDNEFLVGISIDGPRHLHDRYRVDKGGKPTWEQVMRGMELLKNHGVEFNTLTVLNRHNAKQPLEVYRFLKKHGSGFMQFIPLVERASEGELHFAAPPKADAEDVAPVSPMSVLARDFGEFQVAVFDEWVHHDVGQVFVQMFEVQLATWMGLPPSLCVFAPVCGNALALEHNGDVYACDHYVYPEYNLGNIQTQSLIELVEAPQQRKFGDDKRDTLPEYCRRCEVRFACNGECPKHRFIRTPDGEPGLNYLCAGYKRFFRHIDPYLRMLAQLIRAGCPASDIMQLLAARDTKPRVAPPSTPVKTGRNEPCPCGSGKKFKKCCGGNSTNRSFAIQEA
jgi:uncharacterized protein